MIAENSQESAPLVGVANAESVLPIDDNPLNQTSLNGFEHPLKCWAFMCLVARIAAFRILKPFTYRDFSADRPFFDLVSLALNVLLVARNAKIAGGRFLIELVAARIYLGSRHG